MAKKKNVVCLGGGTGTFTVLSGLKTMPLHLSAIVTVADDGGSSGVLRDEFGVLPPGDMRQCIVALAQEDMLLRKLFNYRFDKGNLQGHSFGNLFLVALEQICGSFPKAMEAAHELLRIRGNVIPVTLEKVRLIAELKGGKKISGVDALSKSDVFARKKVTSLSLDPQGRLNPQAKQAIESADVIIIGPGNLYLSIIPLLLVKGMAEALRKSKAMKIYNCNVMTQKGHTDNFSVLDFVRILEGYAGGHILDYVLFNKTSPSNALLAKYKSQGTMVRYDDLDSYCVKKNGTWIHEHGSKPVFIAADLLNKKEVPQERGDVFLQRTFIRHHPKKLARQLQKLIFSKRPFSS